MLKEEKLISRALSTAEISNFRGSTAGEVDRCEERDYIGKVRDRERDRERAMEK